MRLSYSIEEYQFRLYAFCMMTNHYHLVLETPHANISEFMQSVETGYHLYFNKRHRLTGYVSQGPFGAKVVEGDQYLLGLSRYVHLNPVDTEGARELSLKERIGNLRRYRWSSYRSYIGEEKRLPFVDYDPMLALVRYKRGGRKHAYQQFVETGPG